MSALFSPSFFRGDSTAHLHPDAGGIHVSGCDPQPLRIAGNTICGEYFQGRIYEIRVYNQALTASHIQTDKDKPVTTVILVGNTAVGATTDYNRQGVPEVFRMTASTSGSLAKVSVYVDASSTASKLIAGIYTDNTGRSPTRTADQPADRAITKHASMAHSSKLQ
ncbi:MAG: hypothetical protein ACREYC_15310 [Gammaproteobacteria bacterium]